MLVPTGITRGAKISADSSLALRLVSRLYLFAQVELSLLRAWRVEGDTAMLVSRSVTHPATSPQLEVQPSGWLLVPSVSEGMLDLTYVVEIDFASARATVPGASDSRLVSLMANGVAKSVKTLLRLIDRRATEGHSTDV